MKNKRQHRLISTAILMFILVMITALLPVSTQEVQAAKKAKAYKITYKLNGGKNNIRNVKKLAKGKSLTLKNPTRTGYTFKGWYTKKNLKSGKTTRIAKIRKNWILYAKWQKLPTYKITYNLNGGKNNASNVTRLVKGKSLTLKNPTRTGYTFTGWYTNKNLKSGKTTKISKIAKNWILYAGWKKDTAAAPAKPSTSTPAAPSKGTNHAADCPAGCTVDHAKNCANGIHVYETSHIESNLVRHYYTACGGDYTYPEKIDPKYKLWGTVLNCPKCGTKCGSMTIKDVLEGDEFVSKCKHCGKIYQSSVTQE